MSRNSPDNFLAGQVAMVTGGTRGIGRAIAERLLREGARVAICGRSQDGVARAVDEMSTNPGGEIMGERADVASLEDVRNFFAKVDDRFGKLDILINNAGVGIFRSVAELAPEDWHRMIDLNLTGVYYCCHEALPRFRKGGKGGYVINIGSLAGKNPFAGGAGYNASKFGLNGFAEAMMLDHRNDDVRVSTIMPGSVDTDFGSEVNPGGSRADWKIAPEDIAEVVVALVRMPQRTLISRVEIRPSKPKKQS
ncbi:MAG: SDR family oxidoreductase [Acidobacteriota bacterium]|nr:SDR family oxidoreductase [Acidobacteriota bacterium]